MKITAGKIENFVATEAEAKPSLKCIWLDAEGKRLLATNGRMACRVSVDIGQDDVTGLIPVEAFELSRKELKLITKQIGKESIPDPWLNVVCNADTVFIQNLLTNTTHLVRRPKLGADEEYPNVDAVFHAVSTLPTATVDMFYIAEVAKSLNIEGASLSMWIEAPDKAIVMASPSGKCIAVLMPQRVDVNIDEINSRGKK